MNNKHYNYKSNYRLVRLLKPLAYDVYNGRKIAIPAGATGVSIRYRASHLHRVDELGREIPLNVYYWKGKIVHA